VLGILSANRLQFIHSAADFSELFKKAMCHHFYNHLEEFKILYPLQFGFREKKFSTTHALISITEFFGQSIDNSEFGCGIFVDNPIN